MPKAFCIIWNSVNILLRKACCQRIQTSFTWFFTFLAIMFVLKKSCSALTLSIDKRLIRITFCAVILCIKITFITHILSLLYNGLIHKRYSSSMNLNMRNMVGHILNNPYLFYFYKILVYKNMFHWLKYYCRDI